MRERALPSQKGVTGDVRGRVFVHFGYACRMARESCGDWDRVPENLKQATVSVLEKLWKQLEVLTEFKALMDSADALEKKQPPSRPINLEETMKLKAFCDLYLVSRAQREVQKGIRERQSKTEESRPDTASERND